MYSSAVSNFKTKMFFQIIDFLPHILDNSWHLLSRLRKKSFFDNSTIVLPLRRGSSPFKPPSLATPLYVISSYFSRWLRMYNVIALVILEH